MRRTSVGGWVGVDEGVGGGHEEEEEEEEGKGRTEGDGKREET